VSWGAWLFDAVVQDPPGSIVTAAGCGAWGALFSLAVGIDSLEVGLAATGGTSLWADGDHSDRLPPRKCRSAHDLGRSRGRSESVWSVRIVQSRTP
jgi:hypothetical protein